MNEIKNAVEKFIFHCNFEKKLSQKTIKAYKTDLSQFQEFVKKQNIKNDIVEIDKDNIKKYLQNISVFKPRTIKRKVATLKAFFNFLEFEEEIELNPFRKIRIQIKEPKQLPSVMNLTEVKSILKSAYREKNTKKHDTFSFKESIRNIAILELLFATGIRVSELTSLKPENVDLKSNYIKVNGKGSKERVIQLTNNETLSALKMYKRLFNNQIYEKDYFFINRNRSVISEQSVRFMIKKYSKKAGLKRNITPHTFRHTFATLLLEQDVDIKYIQHFLGHSSIVTTQIYTHVNKKQQKKILRTKHPRNSFSSENF